MERIFVRCPNCDDILEAEYGKGKWRCENCGCDVTEQAERQLKKTYG